MYQINHYHVRTGKMRTRKHYGLWNFFWDVNLTALTGGLWLIWIFVREMRGR